MNLEERLRAENESRDRDRQVGGEVGPGMGLHSSSSSSSSSAAAGPASSPALRRPRQRKQSAPKCAPRSPRAHPGSSSSRIDAIHLPAILTPVQVMLTVALFVDLHCWSRDSRTRGASSKISFPHLLYFYRLYSFTSSVARSLFDLLIFTESLLDRRLFIIVTEFWYRIEKFRDYWWVAQYSKCHNILKKKI